MTEKLQTFFDDEEEFIQFAKKYDLDQALCEKFLKIRKELIDRYEIQFQAVYGDTDSIFIYPNFQLRENMQELQYSTVIKHCMDLGKLLSTVIRKELSGTLNLQFEKVITRFFLFAKKRYIGYYHEKDEHEKELKYHGIILVRRDNPEIAKYLFRQIFKYIDDRFDEVDMKKNLVNMFIGIISDILDDKYPKEFFVMTKALKREYKNESIVHFALA